MNNIIMYNPHLTLEQYERYIILASFRFHRGNRATTAKALNIAPKTLYNKLKSYVDKDQELAKEIDIGEPEAKDKIK